MLINNKIMTVKKLKELLDQFADDEKIMIANYSEEDADGNMPLHEIQGAEYPEDGGNFIVIHFDS